jgi:hypothetical protein
MPPLSNILGHSIMRGALQVTQGPRYRRLIKGSKTPREVQAALLARILAANAETEFGKRYGFSQIRNIDDYRSAMPFRTYEDLRPYIERQELTGEPCLTWEQPVYYHRTSGTVGTPKDIPVTETGLRRLKHHQQISTYAQSRGSSIFEGKVFAITGQAIEGRMAGGTPFGSASGLIYQSQSRFVRSRYVLPPWVSAIEYYEARYLAMAIYGLSEPAVTCIATANPSTLVRLLSIINQNSDEILGALATGRLPDAISPNTPIENRLTPSAHRAAHLESKLKAAGQLTYSDIWPDLKGVVTWTGSSCAIPLRNLSGSLPAEVSVIELGYLASEVRATVNVDVQRNVCLPTIFDAVFEFAERDAWEGGTAEFLSLHELTANGEYYVFVTTPEGLYRYDMNDIVRVTGRVNETPTLEFVQKGKGVTNITGEKLHEDQVLDAVTAALTDGGIESDFFIVLADRETAGYTLYVEAKDPCHRIGPDLANDVDGRLRSSNIEYDGKRASGRLAPLKVQWLQSGAGDAYRIHRVANGQRDAQFKYLHLQYAHECSFDFCVIGKPG